MVLNACNILSNCAQEHDFSLLYTAPGVVDWASLFQNWMLSPMDSLRFHAKVLAGYIERNLREDQYFLLDLTDDEIFVLLKMLKDVSTSKLIGSGFDCQFSARELLVMFSNFILSERNYTRIVQNSRSDFLNSAILLVTNAGNTERKFTCRILLKLLNSVEFKKEANILGMEKVLYDNIVSNKEGDPGLNFLCQSTLIRLRQECFNNFRYYMVHYDPISSSKVVTCFVRFLTDLTDNLLPIIERFQGRLLNISVKRYPKINQLLEAITEVYDFWNSCSPTLKDLLLKELCMQSQVLDILHSFIMKIYAGEYSVFVHMHFTLSMM